MRDFRMVFGSVRHMMLIGTDPRHQAIRRRNEQRLAALKASNRLYEAKSEPSPTRNLTPAELGYIQSACNVSAADQQWSGSQLWGIGGLGIFDDRGSMWR